MDKLRKVSVKIDVAHNFKNAFEGIMFDHSIDPYLGFFYAENRLYLIRDGLTDAYWFIEASSPREAIAKVLKRMDDAEDAVKFVPEREEW